MRKQRLKQLYASSLRLQTGLSHDQYNQLLERAGLIRMKGSKYKVEGDVWKNFIPCGEFKDAHPHSKIVKGGKRWYIRLGPKQAGYLASAAAQYKDAGADADISPPRINGIEGIQKSLREALQSIEAEEDASSEDSSYYDATSEESDETLSEDDEEEQEDGGIDTGPNAKITKDGYPMLASLIAFH